jgi:hypothetical protein
MAFVQPGNTPLHKKEVKKVKAKGGGTKKVCLPKAKIASMSKEEVKAMSLELVVVAV